MVDFNKSAKTAKRLIDKNGRMVKFIKNSSKLADESKPWGETDEAQISFDTISSFVDYNIAEIDGDRIQHGDKKLLVNAIDNGSHDVSSFDFVLDGIYQWRIKNVNVMQPADVVVMYEVHIRL